jgi:uncharacterized protein YcbK (DUF882 family)
LPKFNSFAASREWKLCRTIGAIGAAALALTLSTTSLQSVIANGDTRSISMFHTHSKESITVTFKVNGRYDEAGLAKLNHFLRDWRNHKETKMNPHLFDILWEVNRDTGGKEPIQIISAFRSSETNEMLRSRSSGVARFSQHVQGNAIDFRIPGVSLNELRAAGLRLQRGGVGFYPGSDFMHMDTGTIRHWPRMTRDQLARVFPDGKTIHIPTDGVPLKNFQQAAAEIQQRGQFGDRTRGPVTTAALAPETNGLQRFISSIFSSNSVGNRTETETEVEEDSTIKKQLPARTQVAAATPAPQPARTQVASMSPQSILPALSRQEQDKQRLQWQTGPSALNAPEEADETPETTALAYANPADRRFPPVVPQQAALAAAPFAAGADTLHAGFASDKTPAMKHPENARGFAAPISAMVENSFGEMAMNELPATSFQRVRVEVGVVGFQTATPARTAVR